MIYHHGTNQLVYQSKNPVIFVIKQKNFAKTFTSVCFFVSQFNLLTVHSVMEKFWSMSHEHLPFLRNVEVE